MVLSIIIAAFCCANFIHDENNKVFVSYFTYRSMHFLQISAHLKPDTDEVALQDYICLNALLRERLHVNIYIYAFSRRFYPNLFRL